MASSIQLRLATKNDAELLFTWRNDIETRRASHNMTPVEPDSHIAWLLDVLEDPHRRLMIAEEKGVPVGTVRADFSLDGWELSWTVSPLARGRGVAKKMVVEIASEIKDPIRAEVKVGNRGSAKIARYAGMHLERKSDGILYFQRDKID